MGLERAGWRTVSFSEIDPYASAVLAERWPGVPNLGCIHTVAGAPPHGHGARLDCLAPDGGLRQGNRNGGQSRDGHPYEPAVLWAGGPPCQDFSVAGKRKGLAGDRGALAIAWLELVGRHHPRFVLLENVPGLLSSRGGRDMAALVGALVELGYGVGYRVLDARHFGVPQRRRRVFILGVTPGGRAGAERAAEILSVGSRCRRHPPTGVEAGQGTSGVLADGATTARTVQSAFGHHGYTLGAQDADGGYLQLSASPDPRGVRAPDGLAGRSHDRDGVVGALTGTKAAGGWRASPDEAAAGHLVAEARGVNDDSLLPVGLDSHRYRCCGNGVVADVAFWIGERLAAIA
jgi:site-specific DNA-cytosine methylase